MKTRSNSWRTKTESEPTASAGPAAFVCRRQHITAEKESAAGEGGRARKSYLLLLQFSALSAEWYPKTKCRIVFGARIAAKAVGGRLPLRAGWLSQPSELQRAIVSGGAEQRALAQNSNECKAIQFTWLYFERIWTIACGLCHLS